MLTRKFVRLVAIAVALQCCLGAAFGEDVQRAVGLEREFARIAQTTPGKVGVAAIHLGTGEAAYLNPGEGYPMASTYKVAIAVRLLQRVDAGELAIDQLVEMAPGDLSPGSGMISQRLKKPGVQLSIANLLDLMLTISDNSATDKCLELAGGADAVNQRLAELGIEGMSVNRSTRELIADYLGIKKLPPRASSSLKEFSELDKKNDEKHREKAAAKFAKDKSDTATPEAMARLLQVIWSGQALSPASTTLLKETMLACETGLLRIRGMLPPDTPVADKTGTIGGSTNDVGVVTLPDGAGEIAVVVFVKDSTLEVPDREKVIAQIGRAAYDYFLFHAL
jgi:beta-lactamase class A